MKIIQNDLHVVTETWSDSGDYPSNAGAGPLPSYNYVDSIDGTLTVSLEPADLAELQALELDINKDEDVLIFLAHNGPFDLLFDEMPTGVAAKRWEVLRRLADGGIVLAVEEFDASGWEDDSGRDYEDYDDDFDFEDDEPEYDNDNA